jgi:DNA-binding XRE family transcriptional regulator
MTPMEFRQWREQFDLTQSELAKRFRVTRNTVQNWENGSTSLPSTIAQACAVWGDRLRKEKAEIGPVTLCYADAPMWIDAYRPGNKVASMQLEPYPTNSAALARAKMISGQRHVHGPFIMEKSGAPLWNNVELDRVVDGSDEGAPTVRNTIRRLANYILEHSAVFVRGVRMPTVEEIEAKRSEIEETAQAMLQLAAESETRFVSHVEFETLLERLHKLGSYPTNRHVSDVAHAIHGEELVGRWR